MADLTESQQQIVDRTAVFVRSQMEGDSSGHDWWHVWRVWQNSLFISRNENANRFVTELAALLHDIADWKFHDGDDSVGPAAARAWLSELTVEPSVIDHVCDIIATVSFKGAGVETPMATLEGRIVQDADRLEAIGAIGIARCFAFGGAKGRLMHDPEDPPELHGSFEDYKKKSGPSINHFYEKLLLLKDRMNTETGRQLAVQRHQVLEDFLAQFHAEWNIAAG
ncbi:MAG: HD domain-containing protein [Rhodopirellula sp.]|nr:HD domain-containing protein [Rhodopirellula sp.]